MTFTIRFASILGATALALATPLAAQEAKQSQDTQAAEQAQGTQQEQAAEIAAEDVTDAQVQAFVDAILAVEEVRDEYSPQIKATEDEAAKKELVKEANEAAFAAVGEVENMDVDTYVAIANAARDSDALNKRIIARITDIREKQGS